jgi:ribosome-associated protein
VTATDHALELARIAAQAASDKLASDILIVDVSDRLAITDCFVIVTGSNERQVGAIVDAVEERFRLEGVKPVRREGERDGRWVLLDFLDVVVHVQHAEERVFYALDRLWRDCPIIPFVDAASPGLGSADAGSADADVAPADPDAADDPRSTLSTDEADTAR